MVSESPGLKLKAALSLLAETAEQSYDVQGLQDARRQAVNVSGESLGEFWESMKAQSRLSRDVASCRGQLDLAISLADEAEAQDPDATIMDESEGVEYSPRELKSNALYQYGLLSAAYDNADQARRYFEQSLSLAPTAPAQLFLAMAILSQGHRDQAERALQKVAEIEPSSTEAVEATRELALLRSQKPKKKKVALILSILTGLWGIDRFYLGDTKGGLLKFITCGGLYVWWIIDIVRIATNNLRDGNGMRLE